MAGTTTTGKPTWSETAVKTIKEWVGGSMRKGMTPPQQPPKKKKE
jgi:hypothetical protein